MANERRALGLDILGLGPRPGEPQEFIVGVAAIAQPPVSGVHGITAGKGPHLPERLPGCCPVAALARQPSPVIQPPVFRVMPADFSPRASWDEHLLY